MTAITHHLPEELLRAYADGQLPHAYSVVVAAHLSVCDACRAAVEARDVLAGAVLDRLDGVALQKDSHSRMLAALDAAPVPLPPLRGQGIYPAPVVEALGGQPPRWKSLGAGIRQQILESDRSGSLRLLYIPPGKAVPEHAHRGLELTLVLQGAFSDSEGAFRRGDVEAAQSELEHQPVAEPGEPCICLAATDAPLRFRAMIPRLLQPVFRI